MFSLFAQGHMRFEDKPYRMKTKRSEYDDSCPKFSELPEQSDESLHDEAWPPKPHAVNASAVRDLFRANATLIRRLCNSSRLDEEESQRILMPAIANLAHYVHLVPASEHDHHSGYGGLFTHSLEVALYAANQAAHTLFDVAASPREMYWNAKRWSLVCILAGLLHDVGKPYTDMEITIPGGASWDKTVPLLDWLRVKNARCYYISYLKEHTHNEHVRVALELWRFIVPPRTILFLGATNAGRRLEEALTNALVNEHDEKKKDDIVSRILRLADSASCEADKLLQSKIHPGYRDVAHPQGNQLLKGIRSLVANAKWSVNGEKESAVFNTKSGCFIVWDEVSAQQLYSETQKMGYVSIPSDPVKMAEILIDSRAAVPKEVAGHTFTNFWYVTPITMGKVTLACLKMRHQDFVFDTVPPPEIEAVVDGETISDETRKAWMERWGYQPAQRFTPNDLEGGSLTEEEVSAASAQTIPTVSVGDGAEEIEIGTTPIEVDYLMDGTGPTPEELDERLAADEAAGGGADPQAELDRSAGAPDLAGKASAQPAAEASAGKRSAPNEAQAARNPWDLGSGIEQGETCEIPPDERTGIAAPVPKPKAKSQPTGDGDDEAWNRTLSAKEAEEIRKRHQAANSERRSKAKERSTGGSAFDELSSMWGLGGDDAKGSTTSPAKETSNHRGEGDSADAGDLTRQANPKKQSDQQAAAPSAAQSANARTESESHAVEDEMAEPELRESESAPQDAASDSLADSMMSLWGSDDETSNPPQTEPEESAEIDNLPAVSDAPVQVAELVTREAAPPCDAEARAVVQTASDDAQSMSGEEKPRSAAAVKSSRVSGYALIEQRQRRVAELEDELRNQMIARRGVLILSGVHEEDGSVWAELDNVSERLREIGTDLTDLAAATEMDTRNPRLRIDLKRKRAWLD